MSVREETRQTHAQLVVIAARTGKPTVPGTVSQYVLLKARCPVTIMPSPAGRSSSVVAAIRLGGHFDRDSGRYPDV